MVLAVKNSDNIIIMQYAAPKFNSFLRISTTKQWHPHTPFTRFFEISFFRSALGLLYFYLKKYDRYEQSAYLCSATVAVPRPDGKK
jgi:hypothetical protein